MLKIIIPYRDRWKHLQLLIQRLDEVITWVYEIYVIEQGNDKPFNKGLLNNIGFLLTDNQDDSYYCFHDVDMIPEEADYSPPEAPTHLASFISQYNYRLPYQNYFGGVVLFNSVHFKQINGYINSFWGWGQEDDDLLARCVRSGLQIHRRPGKYVSIPHSKPKWTEINTNRWCSILNGQNSDNEGLNTATWETISRKKNQFYEHIKVSF